MLYSHNQNTNMSFFHEFISNLWKYFHKNETNIYPCMYIFVSATIILKL